MAKKISAQPENFELETNTVWSFLDRGKWATHDAKYRGNWSPYVPRNIILRYSKEGDTVLDQFVGGGTTAVEAKLTHRNFIGYDINPDAVAISQSKCDFAFDGDNSSCISLNDARGLLLSDDSVDLICTHPPYADIIHYSENIDGDLSLLPKKLFFAEMGKVAQECYRVLKKDNFWLFELAGFKTKEIIIKEQHNCKATGFWKTNSVKHNFLLLAHEYLFVFKK